MSYQGARAGPMASESAQIVEVSRIAIGPDGRIDRVLWSKVGAKSDANVVARFVVVEHDDGHESLAFEDGPSPGREMSDILALEA